MVISMGVRELQREVTRERILATVLELVGHGRTDDIAVPEVARRSGVSLATIYRYFPTKDALLDAAADEPARQAAGIGHGEMTDGPTYLRSLWRSFEARLPLVRRQPASEAGRAMRARRYPTSRAWFAERVASAGVAPDSPEGARLVRLALLLTSSLAFLDLHDRQALGADAAADDVEWAIAALQRATATELRGKT
jgi:AcrR family transcriptional regulator